jgi:sigma-B regulation protein RsbU (phosphoserine phosphatase)
MDLQIRYTLVSSHIASLGCVVYPTLSKLRAWAAVWDWMEHTMKTVPNIGVSDLIDSLSEGVYVCDLDRTITYWSKSAERITGWTADDVVGRRCCDNVLCHVDKDDHQLCGEEYCPLHRAMVTGVGSAGSLLVFAQGKSGGRVPMHVSVVPLRDDTGRVIGGVETFRDASLEVRDLERAKAIQRRAIEHELPDDPRVTFTAQYIPHDIIGGDFYAIEKLDDNRYGLMLADVMGHGIAAALYTMHLSQLWDRFHDTLVNPIDFASQINDELVGVLKSDQTFATAVCAVVDLEAHEFRFASPGGPQVLHMHADGSYEVVESAGLPLGLMKEAGYEQVTLSLIAGDHLLLFSDGAIEIMDADDKMFGIAGLLAVLKDLGYPEEGVKMSDLEEALLRYSNSIRLPDDLTFIDIAV